MMDKLKQIAYCWMMIFKKVLNILLGIIGTIILTILSIFINKTKFDYLAEFIFGTTKYDEWF